MSGTKVIGKATTAEVVNEAMRRLSLAVNPCKRQRYRPAYAIHLTNVKEN